MHQLAVTLCRWSSQRWLTMGWKTVTLPPERLVGLSGLVQESPTVDLEAGGGVLLVGPGAMASNVQVETPLSEAAGRSNGVSTPLAAVPRLGLQVGYSAQIYQGPQPTVLWLP